VEFFRDVDPIEITPSAPYLILAGDIGAPKIASLAQLLERESKRFKRVFFIAGNHEYYTSEYGAVKKSLGEICGRFENVTFMDKTSIWLPECEVRVLGTTLWSHVPDDSKGAVARSLNDYAQIRIATNESGTTTRKLTVNDTNSWFKDESEWLKAEIEKAKDAKEKVLVMTHHAPLTNGTSAPEHDGSEINCAFSSDMSHLLGDPVKVWVFGHTVRDPPC
jgi:predicted phosphohydrolase